MVWLLPSLCRGIVVIYSTVAEHLPNWDAFQQRCMERLIWRGEKEKRERRAAKLRAGEVKCRSQLCTCLHPEVIYFMEE